MRRSIRWELPLSYAAIALVAALALGGVLLLGLRGYYQRLERDYLWSSAQAIGLSLAPLIEDDQPVDELQARLDSFSFLSGIRIRLFDSAGDLMASSSPPGDYRVVFVPVDERFAEGRRLGALLPGGRLLVVSPGVAVSVTVTTTRDALLPPASRSEWPLEPVRPWRELAPFPLDEQARTSNQVVTAPIRDSGSQLLGFVELSQGPDYAREIVGDVAWGWGIASAVAVALAAAAGWLISRRISAPLLALTDVTTSMAGGDLSVRAETTRSDEFGTLARSFNVMADRVEDTVVTLRRFVSDAAHEIHTPLTTLRANLDLMQQESLPAQEGRPGQDSTTAQVERLTRAQAQIERLALLTQGMLDLSRLEAGTAPGTFEPVSLTALAQEMGELYASRAEQAGLEFVLSLSETQVTVRGDETHLRQLLANLLDNAIKFTPAGGSVELGLDLEEGMAVVWVEDSGIGIVEEDRPHLFQRFHRGRNSAEYPGSGLGLAIVRAIADEHGGQVQAERTGQGSRFSFRLPRVSRLG
ncbi:MAG: HAMP domain-containing histidine kinase [Anaerolineae bacterium]|nr:HAMP domain-containing histidine kinase [Anaerolineae bacterium]